MTQLTIVDPVESIGTTQHVSRPRPLTIELAVVAARRLREEGQSIKTYSDRELQKYIRELGLRPGDICGGTLPNGIILVGKKDNGESLIMHPEGPLSDPISYQDALNMSASMDAQNVHTYGHTNWRAPKADFPARPGYEGESAMLFRARNTGKLQGMFRENRSSSSCVWIWGQADARFSLYLNFHRGSHEICHGNIKHQGLPVCTLAP